MFQWGTRTLQITYLVTLQMSADLLYQTTSNKIWYIFFSVPRINQEYFIIYQMHFVNKTTYHK